MRKAEYSVEEILAAGASLVESGIEVNGWRLRTKLGGGNTRRLFAIWSEHNAPGPVAPPAALPDELSRSVDSITEAVGIQLRSLFSTIYADLAEQSAHRIQEAQMLVDAVRHSANLDAEEASAELDRLEQRIDVLESIEKELTGRLAGVSSELQSTLVELAHFKERSSSQEGQLTQLQADHLQLQNDQALLQQQNQLLSQQLAASSQRITDLESFLDKQSSELLDARRHEQAARERETTAVSQAAILERLRNDDAVLLQRLRLDLSASQKALAKNEATLEIVSSQLEEAKREASELRSASVAEQSSAGKDPSEPV